jgi:hypothetical protein
MVEQIALNLTLTVAFNIAVSDNFSYRQQVACNRGIGYFGI